MRNISLEEKVNAVINFILAETEVEKENAISEMRQIKGSENPHSAINMDDEIMRILCEIGVPDSVKGHRYCAYAIGLAVSSPELIDSITGKLYPSVAQKFNTTPWRAERAIRHAIECAWARCDLDVISEYFGNTVSPTRCKPTNSEFIARLANIIRQKMKND